MIKNKGIQKKNLFKGASIVFAGMFAATLFPMNVITSSADFVYGDIGSEAIILNNAQTTANKGSTYEIRAAYFGSDSKIPVGLNDYTYYVQNGEGAVNYDGTNTITAITSDVTVTYKSSGQEIEVNKHGDSEIKGALADAKSAVYGTVELDNAGEYIVTYTFDVTVGGETKHFSTECIVYSEITTAYFEFDSNDQNIIPSIYDVALQNGTLKNIALPLPTLFDRNEKEVKDVTYVLNTDAVPQEGECVRISVSAGEKPVVVEQNEDGYYIDSKYFDEKNADVFAGYGNYTIKYAYYVGGQFITSITKSFAVKDSYYKDYKLALSQEGSLTSAITGVEATLPTISGKTGDEATPKNESVAISYTVEAYRKDSKSSYSETKKGSIVDGKFTPWANGEYKITYTAKDFYGNEETLSFYISGVKDTQAPEAKIYDASLAVETGEDGKLVYPDASTALKTKTSVGNVIIYAIGATDNVSDAENMKLTRVIKNSSREITIDKYHGYNLIFDYKWETFLANNNYISERLADLLLTSQQEVEQWLKDNKFLIVTDDSTKTVEEGYAYLDISSSGGNIFNGSSGEGTSYTILYYAEDEAGNESVQLSYGISIVSGEFDDDVNPEITFVSNLKNSYRANSVITFEQPTATDDNDDRMDIVTEYFYTAKDGTKYESKTFEEDEYKIDLSEINSTTYEGDEVPNKVTIKVTAKDDYGNKGEWTKEIAIADVQDATAPTIVYEKYNTKSDEVIKQNGDIILPTIKLIDDHVQYLNAEVYVNRIQYVESENAENEPVSKRVETPVTVVGKSEIKDVASKSYILQAGKVVASYAGEYQVKVVFTDAGNNQITTFYSFYVTATNVVDDPVIVGGQLIDVEDKVEVGKAVDLGTPSIDYKLNGDKYDIFGVSTDDAKTALNYNVKVINDAPSSYVFNENEEDTFTAYEPGVYKLQYFVNVSVFDKNIFTKSEDGSVLVEADNQNNKVTPLENGDFVITSSTDNTVKYAVKTQTEYKVYDLSSEFGYDSVLGQYKEDNTKKYFVSLSNSFELIAQDGSTLAFSLTADEGNNLTIGSTSKPLSSTSTYQLDAYTSYYNLASVQEYTLTVIDETAPEILGEYDYPTSASKDSTVSIQKVEARDLSAKGINTAKSYVIISYKGGQTSYSTQYYLDNWKEATGYNPTTGNIDYKLTQDGNYTITYYVYDYYDNVNSDNSYSIRVGDVDSPEIDIADGFVEEKYALGSQLVLDCSKITLSDNKTTDEDKLWDTVKITVTNTSTNDDPLVNQGSDEEHRYSYNLDKAGTYKIEISVTDEAGWTTTKTVEFEVSTDAEGGVEVYKIIGTILIVVAVLVLAGVIAYFVISKVKKNKKAKGKSAKKDKNDKIVK